MVCCEQKQKIDCYWLIPSRLSHLMGLYWLLFFLITDDVSAKCFLDRSLFPVLTHFAMLLLSTIELPSNDTITSLLIEDMSDRLSAFDQQI